MKRIRKKFSITPTLVYCQHSFTVNNMSSTNYTASISGDRVYFRHQSADGTLSKKLSKVSGSLNTKFDANTFDGKLTTNPTLTIKRYAIKDSILGMSNTHFDSLIKDLNGMTEAIKKILPEYAVHLPYSKTEKEEDLSAGPAKVFEDMRVKVKVVYQKKPTWEQLCVGVTFEGQPDSTIKRKDLMRNISYDTIGIALGFITGWINKEKKIVYLSMYAEQVLLDNRLTIKRKEDENTSLKSIIDSEFNEMEQVLADAHTCSKNLADAREST